MVAIIRFLHPVERRWCIDHSSSLKMPRAFYQFHNYLLKYQCVASNWIWNRTILKCWNISTPRAKTWWPHKDEKTLMNDSLFSEEILWGYNIRVEPPFTPKRVHNYKLISMIWVEKQTISNHQEKWRNEMEIC